MTYRPIGTVERAARKDLRTLPGQYRDSGVAKAYLNAAHRLDAGPTDRDAVALIREMRLCLLSLYEMAPPKPEDGDVDEFTRRREQRMGAATT